MFFLLSYKVAHFKISTQKYHLEYVKKSFILNKLEVPMSYGQCFRTRLSDTYFQEDHGNLK